MLTVPSGLETAVSRRIVEPIYYVELLLSTPVRFTSGPTATWNSLTWSHRGIRVSKLVNTEQYAQRGEITIQDPDGYVRGLLLAERIGGKRINIYRTDRGAGVNDVVQTFKGWGGAVKVRPKKTDLTVSISTDNEAAMLIPKRRVGASSGITQMVPDGTVLKIGTDTYIIKR